MNSPLLAGALVCGAVIAVAGLVPGAFGAPAQPGTAPPDEAAEQISLAGQIELARLVDLASRRLNLNVECDEAALKGTVTLRLGGPLSDQELWALVNQLLAAREYTTVRGRSGP